MEKITLSENLHLSRIVLGLWRVTDWGISPKDLSTYINQALEMGVSSMDLADIYGDYECENLFGDALSHDPSLRDKLEVITKCGIKLTSGKYPKREMNHYDTSYAHIIGSAEESLKKLKTDRIDLLLIHRPDPLMDPAEVAKAFDDLSQSGKVLNFGVSNFTPMQYEMLACHFSGKLVTNQVEISPYCVEHFQNENIEFFLKEGIKPMAWSPLAGGQIFKPKDAKGIRVKAQLEQVAKQVEATGIDEVAYAWLLMHPAKIMPIVGSGKLERLRVAIEAEKLELTREMWYKILVAAQGFPMP
ncbi:aldo/keto reductase [Flammeovirgaceae bacterium SG7u.111]|nr:aldo/keto reductase [Flammeovirgaceae bacterium SG7u.132]WPO34786.1 aldo/keto reductase [Flammeovirgaceae bacterium SG7u.111]